LSWADVILIGFLIFLVAGVYSSVGLGGASGYLAILSLFSIPHDVMATSALCLNLLVAGMAFWNFRKKDFFSWRLTWPFMVTSIPAAYLGGLCKSSFRVYSLLLGMVLIAAVFRLMMDRRDENQPLNVKIPSLEVAFPVGIAIGFLAGMVGIGGGILLGPLALLWRWGSAKQIAATTALIILANSMAGLLGRFTGGNFRISSLHLFIFMIMAAFFGGLLGSRLGANFFSNRWLKRILSVILALVAIKLFYTSGSGIR